MQVFPQMNYIQCVNVGESYRMSYTAWGKQAAGCKTLICIHGVNRNCRDWDFVGSHFARLGYYVIAPDIVGRGNSDYLKNSAGYNINTYVADILFMIKILALENIDFIGTSMGGVIGMSIAAMPVNPINKLILNDIGAEVDSKGLERISAYSKVIPHFATLEEAKRYLMELTKGFAVPSELEDFYTLTSFQKNANGRYELKRDPNIRLNIMMVMANNKNIELWELWKMVTLRTLIIRGAKSDILSAATVQKMKAINSKTESVTIEDAGHAPYLYSPQHMQIIQDFLV